MTLFHVFGLPIRAYGLMLVIGFAAGIWRAARVASSRGIDPGRVYDIAMISLISGVLGARLVYVLLTPETESLGEFFAIWDGGLTSFGGLLAVAGWYLYARVTRESFWRLADLVAPSIPIGYALTRIGCFINGCCYGSPTSLPWGVRFREASGLTPPSHPTQIYASIANLLIFLALTRLERMGRGPGFVSFGYLGLYGIYRFLIEFLRAGITAEVWILGMTHAQIVSLLLIAGCAVVIFTVYRKPLNHRKG
mgnify:CR=1 FL=1